MTALTTADPIALEQTRIDSEMAELIAEMSTATVPPVRVDRIVDLLTALLASRESLRFARARRAAALAGAPERWIDHLEPA